MANTYIHIADEAIQASTLASLPIGVQNNSVGVALDTGLTYTYDSDLDAWSDNCPVCPPGPATSLFDGLIGASGNFYVLASSTITNTGASAIAEDIGVSPGTSITGFPPGLLGGSTHSNDAAAIQAQVDLTAAYNDLDGRTPDTDLTGQNLGGMTLSPGIYNFDTTAALTGVLFLDAADDVDAQWIFQIGSTLTTAAGSIAMLLNGGNKDNVAWQVGTSMTTGAGSKFVGNVLANVSITMGASAHIDGRLLARTGAVTLSLNSVA